MNTGQLNGYRLNQNAVDAAPTRALLVFLAGGSTGQASVSASMLRTAQMQGAILGTLTATLVPTAALLVGSASGQMTVAPAPMSVTKRLAGGSVATLSVGGNLSRIITEATASVQAQQIYVSSMTVEAIDASFVVGDVEADVEVLMPDGTTIQAVSLKATVF